MCFYFILEGRGTGSFLMKVGSKRRRTKEEILVQRKEELEHLKSVEEHINNKVELQRKLNEAENQVKNANGSMEMVQHLIERKFVNILDNGSISLHPAIDQIEIE